MPLTRSAIQRMHAQGVLFGPASGRPMDRRILAKAEEWELGFPFDFAIGMNGGELYDLSDGTIEKFYPLQPDQIRTIVEFLEKMDLNPLVYVSGYDHIAALRMDDFLADSQRRNHSHVVTGEARFMYEVPTGKIEVHILPEQMPQLIEEAEKHADPDWTWVKTFEGYGHVTIEFLNPRVNKGVALKRYSEKHNIPLSEFIAFGDMENDIGLLQEAAWGVCLLNGSDAVKAIADDITEYDVANDGVGRYLEKHWFSR